MSAEADHYDDLAHAVYDGQCVSVRANNLRKLTRRLDPGTYMINRNVGGGWVHVRSKLEPVDRTVYVRAPFWKRAVT